MSSTHYKSILARRGRVPMRALKNKVSFSPDSLAEVLGTTDISKICGVTTQTVQSWIDRGILDAFRTPGGHRRVKKQDFLEFLNRFQFPAAQELENGRFSILIADDMAELRTSLSEVLAARRPDARVTLCDSGPAALIQLGISRPDVAILDVFMPGMTGIEILDVIRRKPELKHMAVIIITAHQDRVSRDELLERGARAVLIKPFGTAELLEELEKINTPAMRAN
ncbi:MAG: response regulator [Spirochaetales bacterium]|nr:response regulator [Spirochaetales bacterium]